MSIPDVCREFGISKTTLSEWKNKGLVPFVRLGRRVYFERAAILEAGKRHTKYQHRKG
ncbi:helix-turn-helix domain-containing protein [Hymenobacter sp. B81]|uniref:helix-turn-helix domain-containing protein n=1 Tax=Hymenobacter sp. B81 TaxID=3344878 RepID=UPI0037DC59B5